LNKTLFVQEKNIVYSGTEIKVQSLLFPETAQSSNQNRLAIEGVVLKKKRKWLTQWQS